MRATWSSMASGESMRSSAGGARLEEAADLLGQIGDVVQQVAEVARLDPVEPRATVAPRAEAQLAALPVVVEPVGEAPPLLLEDRLDAPLLCERRADARRHQALADQAQVQLARRHRVRDGGVGALEHDAIVLADALEG